FTLSADHRAANSTFQLSFPPPENTSTSPRCPHPFSISPRSSIPSQKYLTTCLSRTYSSALVVYILPQFSQIGKYGRTSVYFSCPNVSLIISPTLVALVRILSICELNSPSL